MQIYATRHPGLQPAFLQRSQLQGKAKIANETEKENTLVVILFSGPGLSVAEESGTVTFWCQP